MIKSQKAIKSIYNIFWDTLPSLKNTNFLYVPETSFPIPVSLALWDISRSVGLLCEKAINRSYLKIFERICNAASSGKTDQRNSFFFSLSNCVFVFCSIIIVRNVKRVIAVATYRLILFAVSASKMYACHGIDRTYCLTFPATLLFVSAFIPLITTYHVAIVLNIVVCSIVHVCVRI